MIDKNVSMLLLKGLKNQILVKIQQGCITKSDSKDCYIAAKYSISNQFCSFELSIHQRGLKNGFH